MICRCNNPCSVFTSALLAAACAGALPDAAAADAPLALVGQWNLGGSGGWDYLTLDASGARLFISRGTRVDVVDTRSGKITGSIADTRGVHGIALASDLNRG
jgi:hypothetical protein